MKIKHLKTWIICSVMVGLVLTVTLCANRWLTQIVCAQLDESIAKIDTVDIHYGDVKLLVLSGHVWVNDVYMQTDTFYSQADSTRKVTRVEVEQLSIDGVNYWKWLVQKRVQVNGITVKRPTITSWFEIREKQQNLQGDLLRKQMEEERKQSQEEAMELARAFVDEAFVDRITIAHATVKTGAFNNNFRLTVEDASMEIYGIGYSFIDSIPYHYNDSVFHFDVRNVDVILPDGKTTLHSDGMTARPGGVVKIDTTWVVSYLSKDQKQYAGGQIAGLRIGGFDAQKFNQTKSLNVSSIHIDRPLAEARISTIKPQKSEHTLKVEKRRAEVLREQQMQQWEEIQQEIMMFLTEVNIDTIQIHDVSGRFMSSTDHLYAGIDSLSLGVYGIGYSLLDSIPYHYNDSVYEFSLAHAQVVTPDSLIHIRNHGIRYTNGGALYVGETHIHHTIGKWELSERMGKTPQAWIDMTLGQLRTSHKNVVREAMTLEKGFSLDSIFIRIDDIHIAKDARYKAKTPYPVLQTALLEVKYPFRVRSLQAELKHLDIEMAMLDTTHIGRMSLGPLYADVHNITAVRDQVIHVNAHGNIGKGKIKLGMNLHVDEAGTWDMNVDAKDMDMHFLDNFLGPIAGMQIGCNVQHLTTQYGGDGNLATGRFCMEYTDLSVEARKDSPIKAVGDLSGLINSFARTCLPHRNPAKAGKEPRAYKTKWKRNPMDEPELFYIGPIINGAVETMLPGIFAANKVKSE